MDKRTMNNWVVDNDLYKITSNDQPWLINNNGTVIVSPTISDNGSTSVVLTAKQAIIVSFTAEASSESGYDYGYVIISGVEDKFSGAGSKSYREIIGANESIILTYTKDGSTSNNDDSFYIKNLEISEYEVTKYITTDNIRTLLQLLKPRLINTFEISVDDLSDTYLDVYNKCITDIHQCRFIIFNHNDEWYPVTRYAIIGDNIHLYSYDLNKHIMMNNEGAISIVGDDEE